MVCKVQRNPGNPLVSTTPTVTLLSQLDPIIQYDQPYSNHNCGNLQFGPDGMLYIGSGDGGSGNDPGTCTVGTEALTMSTLVPAQRTYRVVDEGAQVYSQHSVEVDTRPGNAQSYILTVLQAHDAGATPLAPSVAEDATSFTVSLNGATAITFAKGMTSTGGSVRIGSATTPLRATVQTISVTGDGPTWAP